MNKDYFFRLWVMSLFAYMPMLQGLEQYRDSAWFSIAFRSFNILNLILLIAGSIILGFKWKYMTNIQRSLSIIGILVNIALAAGIFLMWYKQ